MARNGLVNQLAAQLRSALYPQNKSENSQTAMEHILDNPAYNALISGNKALSTGTSQVLYFSPDVAPFIGLKEPTQLNDDQLIDTVPVDRIFALISPTEISIQRRWKIVHQMRVLQMVFQRSGLPDTDFSDITPLSSKHIPDMLALTKLTNPGPFSANTIAFGNYEGIFAGGQLVAMAGQRLHPFAYTEISAVCTHPEHLGKRYARKLIYHQIQAIQQQSMIPFLHVKSDNDRAIQVYKDLGFENRKEMSIYLIQIASA